MIFDVRMIFDINKPSLREGFGVPLERHQELVESFIYGSRADVVERIVHDETLPPNEKYLLLLTAGAAMVEDEYKRLHSIIENKDVLQGDITE